MGQQFQIIELLEVFVLATNKEVLIVNNLALTMTQTYLETSL